MKGLLIRENPKYCFSFVSHHCLFMSCHQIRLTAHEQMLQEPCTSLGWWYTVRKKMKLCQVLISSASQKVLWITHMNFTRGWGWREKKGLALIFQIRLKMEMNVLIIIPAIAQLVEHLTVDPADIRWSLVRFWVAGFVLTLFSKVTPVYMHGSRGRWLLAFHRRC